MTIAEADGLADRHFREGRLPEAEAVARQILSVQPDHPAALHLIGIIAYQYGYPGDAVEWVRRAIAGEPTAARFHNSLGCILRELGAMDAAIASLRQAVALAPLAAEMQSNLIYALQFHTGSEAGALREEQERWQQRHAAPLAAGWVDHANARDPERRLKVGYVSADFCEHPAAFFLTPLLEAHDPAAVEIHAYSHHRRDDAMTHRLRRAAHRWCEVAGLTDAALAAQIRGDGIDVLVDLSMHSGHNRLLAFARKPAPVQVSWLAYPGTSGLAAMDYRLSDSHLDPLAEDHEAEPERPIRLPNAWCCYEPGLEFPPVGPLPAEATGAVTYGSLNTFGKVTDAMLECWARILIARPGARLLLLCPQGPGRERVRAHFARHGLLADRIECLDRRPWPDYAQTFRRIDLCLDPHPCSGMTTTCHSLWMGVPVVTLAGAIPVARASASLLRTIGLPEFVAQTPADYVRIAVNAADDRPGLAALRANLRNRMRHSALLDAPRFARDVEAAYRTMWRRWCARRETSAA